MAKTVGIDLGTTNSVIAVMEGGEPTVIAVWGPLMVGGTYYAATGTIPGAVLLASLPYAILSTTVLMGKHIDKLAWDAPAGTRTLPVMLGEARARAITSSVPPGRTNAAIFAIASARGASGSACKV